MADLQQIRPRLNIWQEYDSFPLVLKWKTVDLAAYYSSEANILTPVQIETLQDMVDKGQAADLAAAAVMLDWQDGVMQPVEHLYGF